MLTDEVRQIEEIVKDIFVTMLGVELERYEDADSLEDVGLVAFVDITGTWSGTVVMGMPKDVTRASAAAMLQMPEEDVTAEDIRDVAGELVNMIGGNLKSLLPNSGSMSLPEIITGKEFESCYRDAILLDEASMAYESGAFRVSVYCKIEK